MPAQIIPLTQRQHEALRFIQSSDRAPTHQEIGDHLGVNRSSICNMIARLERAGYVSRVSGSKRNLRLVRMPDSPQIHWTRAQGIAFARAWRARMKPVFDAIYGGESAR